MATATATKRREVQAPDPDSRQHTPAAWASLQDPWALLNASRETILEAVAATEQAGLGRAENIGQPYPPGQVGDLLETLEAFREMFSLSAEGWVFGPKRRAPEEWTDDEFSRWAAGNERYRRAQKTVWQMLDRHLPGAAIRTKGIWGIFLHWREVCTTGSPNLFVELWAPLIDLGHKLGLAAVYPVFVCEWCGKIGPAKQKNKRFCGPTCRSRAFRAAGRPEKEKTPRKRSGGRRLTDTAGSA